MAVVASVPGHGWVVSHEQHIRRNYDGHKPTSDLLSTAVPYFGVSEENAGSGNGRRKKRKIELNDQQKDYNAFHDDLVKKLAPSFHALQAARADVRNYESSGTAPNAADGGTKAAHVDDEPQYAELCRLAHLGGGGGGGDLGRRDLEVDARGETAELLADDVFGPLVCNPLDKAVVMRALGRRYLIPARARFAMGDFEGIEGLRALRPEGGFSLVVLDPPWENKSAKRSKSYSWLPHTQLARISVRSVAGRGALVAVWVTNNPRYLDYVQGPLFRKWGVAHVATWYWLKIAANGEPVVPLSSPHRKPYEPLVIGRVGAPKPDEDLPATRVICSVPSRHSRKPPLDEVLAPHLPANPECLELFARSLIPGWTSWGNESIRFQDMFYFCPDAREEGNG